MGIDRLVFHIGVAKTGSSLLQKAMRNLRDPLREHGIAFVDRKAILALPSYTAWAPYGETEFTKGAFTNALRHMVNETRRAAGHARTVVLSNESASGRSRHFGNPFWPHAHEGVCEIVEALAPERTEIVAYVRRQDRFLESFYMERIHTGQSLSWEEHRDTTCLDDRVRYTDLLESVEGIASVTAVRVRPFETITVGADRFVADFLDVFGSGELVHQMPMKKLELSNPSYSEAAWRAALAINPMLDDPDQVRRLRRFLKDLFPSDSYPKPQLLTDAERLELIERYRPDNERLFDRHMPDLPGDTYSSLEGVDRLTEMLRTSPN